MSAYFTLTWHCITPHYTALYYIPITTFFISSLPHRRALEKDEEVIVDYGKNYWKVRAETAALLKSLERTNERTND